MQRESADTYKNSPVTLQLLDCHTTHLSLLAAYAFCLNGLNFRFYFNTENIIQERKKLLIKIRSKAVTTAVVVD